MRVPRALAACLVALPVVGAAQQDSTRGDSLRGYLLAPVQVSVTRAEARLDHVAQSVSAVRRDELLRGRPGLGLDEALAAVPGILVANRYNFSLDQLISIRGFGARSSFGVRGVKILLDGVPQTLPDGQGQLSNVQLGDATRVEVLRGSASSLYGNAAGGVISIATAEPPRAVTPGARISAGEFALVRWDVGIGAPLGRGSVGLTVSRTTADGFRRHAAADIRQAAARLLLPVGSGTRLHLAARFNDSPELQNPGALTAAELAQDPRLADPRNVTAGAGKAIRQAQLSLGATHDFDVPPPPEELAPSAARGGGGQGERFGGRIEGAVFGLARDLTNPLAFRYIELDRVAGGFRTVATLPVALGAVNPVISAGLDAQWQRDDRVERSPDRATVLLDQLERAVEVGPFVQAGLPLGARTTLSVGLRYDRVTFAAEDRLTADGDDSGDRLMDQVSWSAGITHELHRGFAPYVGVATSFETPTTTELANRPDGTGGFNPDLEPQRAISYDVGVRGRLGEALRYAVAGYVADVRDELIPFELPGSPTERFFRNAGTAWHRGIEVEVAAAPARGLYLSAAYTHSSHAFREYRVAQGGVTDTLDGHELPGVPRRFAHLSLRYDFPSRLWTALDVTSSSSYFVDDANTTRNEPWTVTGVRAGWDGTLGGRRVAPFVGVLNLFDERYVGSVVVNARGGRFFEPAPGRTVYVGIALGAAR